VHKGDTEMWKKLNGFANYSINEEGQVRNDTTGQIKKPTANKANGYLYVDLYEGNKRTKRPIHRLVAEAFVPNPDNLPCIDHADGNRQNNAISNLRWASFSQNNSRFETIGVRSQAVKVTHYKEERNRRGGGHIKWLDADLELRFNKISDVADYFGVSIGNISLMLGKGTVGQRGKMRGYKFEYLDGERNRINV